MSDNMNDTGFLGEESTLIRAPIDPTTGEPFEKCGYALFPGLALAESEPELVVLLYDSILHQHSDTAIFLYKGREGADPLLNRKWQQRLLTRWRKLGKPTMIVVSPEDMKFFRGRLGEIKTVSIYDELLSGSVTGGCNRELYRLALPENYSSEDSVRQLADMMGAVIESTDDPRVPYLTNSIEIRNSFKRDGLDAVHILELIYGMGRSNAHLAHTHSESHDHEHEHEAPKIRETAMSAEEKAACNALFDSEIKKQNLRDVKNTLLQFFWGE